MRTRFTLVIALILGLAAPFAMSAPASASFQPTISALDISTPGQVTGTVTTDAPYVRIGLYFDPDYEVETQPLKAVPPTTHRTGFQFETWGIDAVMVLATPCATSDPNSCVSDDATWSERVTPRDVVPNVSFSGDTNLGPGDSWQITTSDPQGGGELWVRLGEPMKLNRGGSITTNFAGAPDGDNSVDVYRCRDGWVDVVCHYVGVSKPISINRSFDYLAGTFSANPYSPKGGPLEVRVYSSEGANLTLDWELLTEADPAVSVASGVESGLEREAGILTAQLDVPDDIPDGKYALQGSVSYTAAGFGRITGEFTSPGLVVDGTPSSVIKHVVDFRDFYPARDTYRDTVTFDPVMDEHLAESTLEISTLSGEVVRTKTSTYYSPITDWDGTATDGTQVPAGPYRVKFLLVDLAGNETEYDGGIVTVHDERRYQKVLIRRVDARSSLLEKYAAKCAKVSKVKGRPWKKGVGLYSSVKCSSKKWKKNFVVIVNGTRIPAGSYSGIEVRAFGGAAKSEPRSRALLEVWNAKKQEWGNFSTQRSKVKLQYKAFMRLPAAKYGDGYVAWRTYTGGGARYDIKYFEIRVPYYYFK